MSAASDRARRYTTAVLLVGMAGVHGVLAARSVAAAVVAIMVALAVCAVTASAGVVWRPAQAVRLAAAVVGAAGVATSLIVALIGLRDSAGSGIDPWSVAALLVDALVVRLAVADLRLAARAPGASIADSAVDRGQRHRRP